MDHQLTFADSEFNQKRRQTRKEKFLERMDKLIPWKRLESVISTHDDAAHSLYAAVVQSQ